MKIRLGETLVFVDIDVSHPYFISVGDKNIKNQLKELIEERELKCDGCGKKLNYEEGWLPVIHRPKSSVNLETEEEKDLWGLFFFCHKTRVNCLNKWKDRRPK